MAKDYRLTFGRKVANRFGALLARRGMGQNWILTTTGATSGERRDVVITPVEIEGRRYLVAPYGATAWVRNLRSHPRATLSHGGASIRIIATEVGDEEAGRALAKYYADNRKYVAEYMDVPGDKTITDFIAAADRYPVFRADT